MVHRQNDRTKLITITLSYCRALINVSVSYIPLCVSDQCSDGVKVSDSARTGNLFDQNKDCILHVCCNSCTFEGIHRGKE